MHKIIALFLLIPLAFLTAHSGALPATRSSVSETNEPRTLLGKPYKRLSGQPPRLRPLWTSAKQNDNYPRYNSGAQLDPLLLEAPRRPLHRAPLPLLMNSIPQPRKGPMVEPGITRVGPSSLSMRCKTLSRRSITHGREPGSSRPLFDSDTVALPDPPMQQHGPQRRRSSRSQGRSEQGPRLPQEYGLRSLRFPSRSKVGEPRLAYLIPLRSGFDESYLVFRSC
ncbi:hypothetical protein F5I97DRAFT_1849989 [Phlebopus sp. FC_14]|nr:hypothetical protein F5I97DRAFT_1849989 [Phlebopus sp. FC_14]